MASQVARDLVEAARAGDETEIERLVGTIWPDACRLAYAILGDNQGAEDAAQEACIIVYRTIASLKNSAAFRVWFYRILAREAFAIKRRRLRTEPVQTHVQLPDHTAEIDVWRALSTLPQKLRDVIVLRYFEDLSSREIASVLDIPDGTVRFRLMIARRRLRPLLSFAPEHTSHHITEIQTHGI